MKSFLRPIICFLFLFSFSLLLVQCDHSEVPLADVEKAKSKKNPYAVSANEALEVAKNYESSKEGVTKAGARVGADSEVVGEETVYDDTDKKPLSMVNICVKTLQTRMGHL
jgi:hypothetical protein